MSGADNQKPWMDPPDLPPASFDPVCNLADREMLEHYWLPSRPEPALEPELYGHWAEMFQQPLRFVWSGTHEAASFLVPTERSPNWSGAYTLPNRGARFKRVVGRWRIPDVGVGAGSNPFGLPFRCSIWVGLDGKKHWSRSLPQVGSVQGIADDGTPEEPSLWWQWWLRDAPSKPHTIDCVKIRPGDEVLCSLTVVSELLVRFHVKNRNTGAFATFAVNGTEPVLGSTAEWIIERPADSTDSGDAGPLFPLPNYGEVHLRRCAARLVYNDNGTDEIEIERIHWEPRLIRMGETFSNPTRVEVISIPRHRGQPPNTLRMKYRLP
jgi:hypothetical protein